MSPLLIIAAAATPAAFPSVASADAIVVTAARTPIDADQAPASASVFDRATIEGLGLPAAADILRLAPGVSVSVSGPRGSQTQLRIRGAEANHSLLFVDGIRFNDPAAGNEPRFELLTNDALARIEIVRGPQSALWGSEALGGVVAVETADPLSGRALSAVAEYGSFDSVRVGGQFATGGDRAGISGAAGWMRSDGIDSFGTDGEKDGFENLQASLKGVLRPGSSVTLGIVGHWVEGESEFDGYDPVTFRRADTLDATRNRVAAVRGWTEAEFGQWSVQADLGYLASANRNLIAGKPLNRTAGERVSVGAQVGRRFAGHQLTAAVEHEAEDFRARDQVYFGGTDQDRSRNLTAIVGEWRGEWTPQISTDVAIRHDSFSAFIDATTVRAAAMLKLSDQWRLHGAYGEGIAQPTFYDLFGFFPGSFVGNPALKPEHSRGWEVGGRWQQGPFAASLTGFSNSLRDEIVDTYDPATFLSSTANASGRSSRRGIEAEARWRQSAALQIGANYTYLDAEQRQTAGARSVRELRRPRHSFNLFASGQSGQLTWSGTAAYVGKRGDTDFEAFPSRAVTLDDYLLASLRVGWQLTHGVEAYARAENVFDADYQDAVGYRTPGRSIHAGLRFRLGD